ncbi:hypothetical protein LSH36_5g05006 [Paralvinella palmiformis]|uniref:Translocon-associated protein subunit beta n=1 Tax=Paralvinella palmiformis TaxID=53620 RepID=A0AAD9KGA2_9ANNE|nr:hypothetical protein LSH36_5g05006 [Paralvinella palmiformis]
MRDKKGVSALTSDERRTNVTAVVCTSATGEFIPPMPIIPRVRFLKELINKAPTDLLILDGHSSHTKNLELIRKKMKHVVVLSVLAFACLVQSADDDEARLLVSKNILNTFLVEGKDLTLEYGIYNVGGSSALNVHLHDGSFKSEEFQNVAGSLDVKWERLAPGSNVTHVVVLRPLKSGYYNFSSAEVTYLASDMASERKFGYTTAPGEYGIVNLKDYDRKFSPHVLDWAAFAVMTLPSLGIPFLLWYNSKCKYEQLKTKKN